MFNYSLCEKKYFSQLSLQNECLKYVNNALFVLDCTKERSSVLLGHVSKGNNSRLAVTAWYFTLKKISFKSYLQSCHWGHNSGERHHFSTEFATRCCPIRKEVGPNFLIKPPKLLLCHESSSVFVIQSLSIIFYQSLPMIFRYSVVADDFFVTLSFRMIFVIQSFRMIF